jgi:hypothetical protein
MLFESLSGALGAFVDICVSSSDVLHHDTAGGALSTLGRFQDALEGGASADAAAESGLAVLGLANHFNVLHGICQAIELVREEGETNG